MLIASESDRCRDEMPMSRSCRYAVPIADFHAGVLAARTYDIQAVPPDLKHLSC